MNMNKNGGDHVGNIAFIFNTYNWGLVAINFDSLGFSKIYR